VAALLNGSEALIVSTKLASELKKLWLVMRNPSVKQVADRRRWSSAVEDVGSWWCMSVFLLVWWWNLELGWCRCVEVENLENNFPNATGWGGARC